MLLLVPPAAGDPDPAATAALAAKRAKFEAAVASALEPVNKKYAAALRRLEKEFALAKNYEAAIAVRDERLAVEKALAGGGKLVTTGNGGGTSPNKTPVPVAGGERVFAGSAATAADGAVVDGGYVNLTGPGQSAEWALSGLSPGGYQVVVTYDSKLPAAFQVKEHFFRLNCDAAASSGKAVEFGTLKVTSRAKSILLTATKASAASPLRIKEVKLISNQ